MSDEDQPPVPDLQQTEVHDRQKPYAEDECVPEPLDEFEDVGLPTNMQGSDEYFETSPNDRTYDLEDTNREVLPEYVLGSHISDYDAVKRQGDEESYGGA
jgi:hypothetical protein